MDLSCTNIHEGSFLLLVVYTTHTQVLHTWPSLVFIVAAVSYTLSKTHMQLVGVSAYTPRERPSC